MTREAQNDQAAPRFAAYGEWISPISAADVAAGVHSVEGGIFVGDEVWWSERRPTESGRTGVYRRAVGAAVTSDAASSEIHTVLPAPASARSRVHEYGGGAWTATPDGRLVYVEGSDQRVRVLTVGGDSVVITPELADDSDSSTAYGELAVRGDEVIAVREVTRGHRASRHIVAIPLDGSAAVDASVIRVIVGGSDFVAYPRFSPDGSHLAWIAWDHPQMPWDGTELRLGSINAHGAVEQWSTLLGGPDESVLQPEWRDEASLWAVTDASGFWRPAIVRIPSSDEPVALTEWPAEDREVGGPLWNLGGLWYLPLADGRLLARSSFGSDRLEMLGAAPDADADRALELPFTSLSLSAIDESREGSPRVLLTAGSAEVPGGLFLLDVLSGRFESIRSDHDSLPDPDLLPRAEERTFGGKDGTRSVHAVVYPPRNPGFRAPEGELPPYVVFVHGGPTAHAQASVNLTYAYYTSRGIGVVDVNYGGSTGYGREYRDRLKGQWGVVDVEDVETVAHELAESGIADGGRIAIEGGSAGGWTVLSALVRGEYFACGVSLYGVADLRSLAEGTHDFEARYTDGLVGPLPEAEELYIERSPLTHVGDLDRPVLLLQGLDDRVVPPSQSEQFRDALVAAGVPHAYVTFAGESHGFRRAETKIRVREAALSFYGQTLGFTPPGVPVLELWRPSSSDPALRTTSSE